MALPRQRHPRAVALAQRWVKEAQSPRAVVLRGLAYFKTQGFAYTLLPPALPGDSVDQFLFETRAGFCEHFAASFTVLMRAAGIPARVVTGYQGGEYNPVSDYLLIRQRDAHAWAEVYLPHEGWVRVDPTSVVAPSRLSLGIESFADMRSPLRILDRNGSVFRAWRGAAAWWEAVNFEWAQWVLGYSTQRQQDFLAELGWEDVEAGDLLFGLTGEVALILGGLARVTLKSRNSTDPVVRAYAEFCRKLAHVQLLRAPHEGPLSYAQRVVLTRPDLGSDVAHITALYTTLRYAGARIAPSLLRNLVRKFSPRRHQ
ncbi:MAG: DUF4129 domain-containing protein [Gammaproteobacteria bacterium]|nr:DUF4129 domain-containing protein [Gammaproteobacteria bacterium]